MENLWIVASKREPNCVHCFGFRDVAMGKVGLKSCFSTCPSPRGGGSGSVGTQLGFPEVLRQSSRVSGRGL
eukprot:5918159-Amphidinium_carterae.1